MLADCSVKDAALVGRDHVLDVNEGVVATVLLEKFQSGHDQVAEVGGLALLVVDLVTEVVVLCLEQVHDGQDLAVVGHEGLTDGVRAKYELLQDVEGSCNDLVVTSVQGSCQNTNTPHLKLAFEV